MVRRNRRQEDRMISAHEQLRRIYEDVPYLGVAEPESHVRCLHALAVLHGIPAADVRSCRVLELGCAAGRNLIPQAADYPGSRFVGADFSALQIADGQAVIAELSLDNIELRHVGLEHIDASWGRFDYILCLGVFSWVTPDLQSQLLSICRENLAPHGVALISFNAYPGWHQRTMVRDLLRYHVAAFADRRQQIAEARALLEFVAANSPAPTVQGRVFQAEREHLRTVRDDYLFHEYLVDDNHPQYLHQFVQRAEAAELQFVTDAELWRMSGAFMPAAVQPVLANTPLLQRCQLLDFLRNETFHKTLLCHRQASLRRDWNLDTLQPFFLSFAQKPKPVALEVDNAEPVGLEFPFGALTVSQPLGKAAIKYLIDVFPAAVSLEQLHAGTLAALPPDLRAQAESEGHTRSLLAQSMLDALRAGLLKVYMDPPRFCDRVSARPCVTPLARCLAARGDPLVSQRHDNVKLDPLQTFLVPLIDGSRDVSALIEVAEKAIADGRLTPPAGNPPVSTAVEIALCQLCNAVLLVR
jgi:SAM-dependent methyltransferase